MEYKAKWLADQKNSTVGSFLLFLPPALWILYLAISKLHKRSANDEKWRDCFSTVITTQTSASGKVEESQNMAE